MYLAGYHIKDTCVCFHASSGSLNNFTYHALQNKVELLKYMFEKFKTQQKNNRDCLITKANRSVDVQT